MQCVQRGRVFVGKLAVASNNHQRSDGSSILCSTAQTNSSYLKILDVRGNRDIKLQTGMEIFHFSTRPEKLETHIGQCVILVCYRHVIQYI